MAALLMESLKEAACDFFRRSDSRRSSHRRVSLHLDPNKPRVLPDRGGTPSTSPHQNRSPPADKRRGFGQLWSSLTPTYDTPPECAPGALYFPLASILQGLVSSCSLFIYSFLFPLFFHLSSPFHVYRKRLLVLVSRLSWPRLDPSRTS